MHHYTSDELANITQGVWHALKGDLKVTFFCFDARMITPGACFVALSGGVRDGHEFAAQAVQGGALAVIVECRVDVDIPQLVVADSLRALGALGAANRAVFNNPVVAITGSCGKTSTKEMLRLLLGETVTHATAGNWNNRIGVPMTLLGLDSQAQTFGVIEAGINQPKEMQLLGEMIHADLTITTNIGPAHLELLKTIENVAVEKAHLSEQAKHQSPVIFPSKLLQYPSFTVMAAHATVLQLEEDTTLLVDVHQVVSCRLKARRNRIHEILLIDGQTSAAFEVATTSRGIATNAALAILAARKLGILDGDIRQRLKQWLPAGNRGKIIQSAQQLFYVDCYNANPSSMSDALQAFTAAVDDVLPRAYVLGAMNELGEGGETAHFDIGQQLRLRPQDTAFFVGPDALSAAYEAGALDAGNSLHALKRVDLVEKIKFDIAQFEGTLFLKGSRNYQLEKLLPDGLQ